MKFARQKILSLLIFNQGVGALLLFVPEKKIIKILVTNLGVSLAETARQVGVSTAAVSNTITRLENKKS
jgi:DNA-binding MarR family transcriptional regulator